MATISTRVDDSIKEDFAKLCESMGLSMGTAVTLWIKQFLRTKKLEVTIDTEEEFNHGVDWIDFEGASFDDVQSILSKVNKNHESKAN